MRLKQGCILGFLVFLILMGILSLSFVQSHVLKIPYLAGLQLHGVVREAHRPAWSMPAWFSGKFQQDYEGWLNENVGLRSVWVRTENQINWMLFREFTAEAKTEIILGKDNWLYEKRYVDQYRRPSRTPEAKLREKALAVKRFQDLLAAKEIAFLVVIAPSKAEIYPEYIPDPYLPPHAHPRHDTDYHRMLAHFKEFAVPCVDARRIFLERKPYTPYPFFVSSGTHWSYYGAFVILQEILRALEKQMGRRLPVPELTSVQWQMPQGADTDLSKLLNIWTPRTILQPAPYPFFSVPRDGYRANVLYLGDSFIRTQKELLWSQSIHGRADFIWAYKWIFQYPEKTVRRIGRDRIAWDVMLLSRDAVVIVMNEIFLADMGHGFLEDALQALGEGKSGS